MIFVDTSAWFALFVDTDDHNRRVRNWVDANYSVTMITTDYVVDELLTLARARGRKHKADFAGERILSGEIADLEFVTVNDFSAAWTMFRKYSDKNWSFTDCTSFVVMQRLGIQMALAFDDHFRQFGAFTVHPA